VSEQRRPGRPETGRPAEEEVRRPSGGAPRAAELRVVFPRRGTAVVEFTGEHDLAAADSTAHLLTELVRSHTLVVIDLSHVAFIDSSVLIVLVNAHRLAVAEGRRLRVQIGSGSTVRTVFDAAGVLDYLDCVADRDEALRAGAPPRASSS
jgi:anti-anti-sigma factor